MSSKEAQQRYRESHVEELKAYRRAYYLKNRDRINAYNKAYVEAHPEKQRIYKARHYDNNRDKIRNRAREWKAAHPDYYPRLSRDSHLRRTYNLTLAEYNDHVIGQAGRCLICLRVPATNLVPDHDHTTGRVRGLICQHCNRMLGDAHDEAHVLRAGAAYLERSQ